MKDINVCGLGNGIVDVFLDISESDFASLGFERGSMRLVETGEQTELLEKYKGRSPGLVSGGSVANSIIALAQLGGKGGLISCLANDAYGTFYRKECEDLGIAMPVPGASKGMTGTCVVLITPDAERTMRTCLAVSADLSNEHVDEATIRRSDWLFIEGYPLANPGGGRAAVAKGVELAKANGTKVAVTCSEPWVVSAFNEALWAALERADLVFCNEEEALALSGASTIQAAGSALSQKLPKVVITGGPKGAYIWWDGETSKVDAFPCEPRDLTGAGDMFAGSFLYGVTHGYNPSDAARHANFLARSVISQVGARLRCDVPALWKQAV